MAQSMEKIIFGFVAVIVGVVLISPLQSVVDDSNITGITATIVTLIPLFFGISVLLVSVKSMTGKG